MPADSPSDDVERRLFEEVLDQPAGAGREAWLKDACGGDAALEQRIAALLRAHEQESGFLPDAMPTVVTAATEHAGERIGHYKLLQQIGEGGFGTVWMAEQFEPVSRRVALKIIKLGMDTREVIARFEAERQALAMMEHPNIAKVFDAGATETGRPFFVMELVKGIPITQFCDGKQLGTRERLLLFEDVCSAINHAHQKGVIHRDIKPSNVLVTLHGDKAVVKVIDFGIAKATQGKLTDKTLFTRFEQMIGTPAYMSPEQAGLGPMDIDTRSDIYSLGVLLYELLTGRPPFDPKELLDAGLEEMRRVIREVDPPKPSTRLTQRLTHGVPAPAGARPPKGGTPNIADDLDWIVMKAIEKDRSRRYETANGLALDIQRFLADEPVSATPPSAGYRFRKFARRNRTALRVAAGVAVVLILATIVSSWQAIRATRAEQAQSRLRSEAELARAGEARERSIAEQRLYDSLVGEASATRIARRVGYREGVFQRLRQANALDVPRKNVADLRREWVACLGDFVGFQPEMLGEFPGRATVSHPSSVHLDPLGERAAFALSDGAILVRETTSGRKTFRLEADQPAWRFCFDGQGGRVASIHLPGAGAFNERLRRASVRLWTRTADGSWTGDGDEAVPGAYECLHADGRLLVVTVNPEERVLELRDARDRTVVERVPFPQTIRIEEFRARPALSPDARWLAVPAGDEVEIWSLAEHRSVARLQPGLFFLSQAEFSPDGKFFACLSGRGCAIYTTNGFSHVATLAESGNAWVQFTFGHGSTLALPLPAQKRIRIWDMVRNKDVAALDVRFTPYKADFSAAGERLLVAGLNEACIFQAHVKAEVLRITDHALGVPGICFSPDGRSIAAVDKGRTMALWDATTGRSVWETRPLPDQGGHSVGFSPDGRLLATGHWSSRSVCIWDARTGQRLQSLRVRSPKTIGGVGQAVGFSPDGRFLVSAHSSDPAFGENTGLVVWSIEPDTSGGPGSETARTLGGRFQNLSVAPDGSRLAFASLSAAPRLHVWELRGDRPPQVIADDILQGRQSASFTPDSSHLVFLDSKRNVVLCEVAGGLKTRSFPTLEASHTGGWAGEPNLLPSPDGSMIAVTSPTQRSVDVWEFASGRLLYSLPDQAATIEWLAWAPETPRLAVSRTDGEIAIWNLAAVEKSLAEAGLSP